MVANTVSAVLTGNAGAIVTERDVKAMARHLG